MEETLNSPFFDLTLKRYPRIKDEKLRAWDAADELILEEISSRNLSGSEKVLIVNDQWGALSLNLNSSNPHIYQDSFVCSKGIIENARDNKLQAPHLINDLNTIEGVYDLIIIKLPKSMSFFEDILISLQKNMTKDCQVIIGVMIKHLPKVSFKLLEKYVGTVTTSLAKKKARLLFSKAEQPSLVENPYPLEVKMPNFDLALINHSNVFSREKLDVGTRFFLEHIPKGDYSTILDIGCGNGIVGLKAKMLNPASQITFSDESFMAVKSARENYKLFFEDEAHFHWTNCFEDGKEEIFDLVLCNPPFHQNNTIGDFIAWNMFQDAKKALKKEGRLLVIGNRHLGYHAKLKRIFKNVELLASNQKFTILECRK
ncbi:methyltransferase [Halobacteriovorax sp. GB3]|uniref:methyltransferase n=1 Tax=Halobacteriovorax sp. GB3 TaxID=2719615 RepID=UPI00235DC845|nr:methyltransferase [Halobacteriovorax sp. GB3]MDD0851912.1 methyltransferase [Halobacteriovorax sp. GB3]